MLWKCESIYGLSFKKRIFFPDFSPYLGGLQLFACPRLWIGCTAVSSIVTVGSSDTFTAEVTGQFLSPTPPPHWQKQAGRHAHNAVTQIPESSWEDSARPTHQHRAAIFYQLHLFFPWNVFCLEAEIVTPSACSSIPVLSAGAVVPPILQNLHFRWTSCVSLTHSRGGAITSCYSPGGGLRYCF